MSNEQWKTDGDCSKCRRKKYCTKACTKHKKVQADTVSKMIGRGLIKRMVKQR